jgi:hypothetical protein
MEADMTQAVKQPLRWRIADVQGTGMDHINVVMPESSPQSTHEILLATDIPSPLQTSMDIKWSEEDAHLFQMLLVKLLDLNTFENLELENPEVVDVLHIVAAAHFLAPVDADVYLEEDVPTVLHEVDVGDLIAIHTKAGFKSAVIAELDSIEAVCVLIEPLEVEGQEELDVYDTLVVNKHSLLPAEFGNVVPGEEATIH